MGSSPIFSVREFILVYGLKGRRHLRKRFELQGRRDNRWNTIPEESEQGQVHRWRYWPSTGKSLSQRLQVRRLDETFSLPTKGDISREGRA